MTKITFALALLLSLPLVAQTRYQVVVLPDLGSSSQANGINNRGWVTGGVNLPGGAYSEASAWINGALVRLGTLGGPNSLVAWPITANNGVIAGISETAALDPVESGSSCQYFYPTVTGHACQGFRWQDGVMTALPTLGGPNSYATALNNKGQIVGWAENTVHDPTCAGSQVYQFRGVIWQPDGTVQELTPLAGDSTSTGNAINDLGDVVGISGPCYIAFGFFSAKHAVLWHNGVPRDLGNFGGKAWNTPTAMNNQGVVVGFADVPGDDSGAPNFIAFVWTEATGIQKLAQLPGENRGGAFGINNKNQIVGQTKTQGHPYHATIWDNGNVYDLNTLTQPGAPYLIYANSINDAGVIVGEAFDPSTGQAPAYIAYPVSK